MRVDLLNTLAAVDFDAAWENRVTKLISGVDVPLIGIKDLIANKHAAGRHKDLADAESLESLD